MTPVEFFHIIKEYSSRNAGIANYVRSALFKSDNWIYNRDENVENYDDFVNNLIENCPEYMKDNLLNFLHKSGISTELILNIKVKKDIDSLKETYNYTLRDIPVIMNKLKELYPNDNREYMQKLVEESFKE